MEYKIGDVSKILNISDQMIRYYEKLGVITPKRKGDGKYRYYDTMDVFWLYEAMKYKEWDINIAEFKDIINDDFFDKIFLKADDFSKQIENKIKKEEMLLNRINEIKKRLVVCKYNLGNFWVEQTSSKYIYYSNIGYGDEYELSPVDTHMKSIIFGKEGISYFDALVKFNEDNEEWCYAIDKDYHDKLGIEDFGQYELLPKQLCLCTIIDMGELGEFNSSCLKKVSDYMNQKGYQMTSKVFGIIIGRGKVKGKFNRIMQIYAPITTL